MNGIAAQKTIKDALNSILAQGKERAQGGHQPVLVSLTQQAAGPASPLATFSARSQTGIHRSFWGRPKKDFWLVAIGKAAELNAAGTGSVEILKTAHRSLLEKALIQSSGPAETGPLLLGGFRYDPIAPRDSVWRDFPDAALILPRLLLTFTKGKCWITFNQVVNAESDCKTMAERLLSELPCMDTASDTRFSQPEAEVINLTSRQEWRERVCQALETIRSGALSKVVLSRRKAVEAGGRLSLECALERLSRVYPECAVFAVDTGQTSFAGATPEILAHVEKGKLYLSCLASSAPRGTSSAEDGKFERELMASPKEQREHFAVLTMLTETLKESCTDIQYPKTPEVWKLKNVQHLLTPVSAELKTGCGILDIVKQLHPTPAVGGSPTEKALEFVRDSEGDRGWYAGPIGWVDQYGNGEFGVAIRSALIDHEKAYLYAGAGIVQGSDPDLEYAETEVKFQPMLAALTQNNQ